MSLRIQWVRYGRPAAEALRAEIAGMKDGQPLRPVSVVVPSNYLGVSTRRLLASGVLGPICARGAGLSAVTFVTVYRLAELLGSSLVASRGRRPVSTPVIAAALRAALAEEPGIFAPVASHPATEAALVGAYRELRDISASALAVLASRGDRSADVVRIHLVTRSRLETQWYDEEDLMDAAIEVLAGGDKFPDELGSVVVYLPQRLSLHGAALLRELSLRSEVAVLAGESGDPRADFEVARSLQRLAPTGDSDRGPREFDLSASVNAERTRIVTVSDADEELRAATRAVVEAARNGTPFDRIAILYPTQVPYGRLTHDHLESAGIPFNGTAVAPLTENVVGRSLIGLLGLGTDDFRRDRLFAWLAGAELLYQGRSIPVASWERLSRDANVVSGREHWDRRLSSLAEEAESAARRDEADPEAPPWRAELFRADAESCLELRSFVLGLIDDLTEAATGVATWATRAAWAQARVEALVGSHPQRRAWPLSELRAIEKLQRALERLARLDQVEGPIDLDVFVRTLTLELEADLGRVGRLGTGVLVGPVSSGVGLDLDLVVILGLAEGIFPTPPSEDSLLPDRERQAVAAELASRSLSVERQHRELLAVLAGASRQFLCVPRGDLRRSEVRVASRWVMDIARGLGGSALPFDSLVGSDHKWLTQIASFEAGLKAMAFPARGQDHRLRSLMAVGTRGFDSATLERLGDPATSHGAAVVAGRRSSHFTRFDGNLAGLQIPSPAERVTSATRLEHWAACPFAYFVGDILGVQEVEDPELVLVMSPLDRGSLVHEVLERFVSATLGESPEPQPLRTQERSNDERSRMVRIAEEVFGEYEARGLTGRSLFWDRDRQRIMADLISFANLDRERREALGSIPIAVELAFGLPGAELPSVGLDLPDGRRVNFRGIADRIDLADDGSVHVVDYKTGRSDRYVGLCEDNPDLGGLKLQLAVYGQAARLLRADPDVAVHAEYWFVSTKGRFRRVGYPVTPEVLARVGSTLARIVQGIEGGTFPNYPSASSTSPFVECAFCDPDMLGVGDLRRAWERKFDDTAMAPFTELVSSDRGAEDEQRL